MHRPLKWSKPVSYAILAASILVSAGLFLLIFRMLPIEGTTLGSDWRTIWRGVNQGQAAFGVTRRGIGGMYTPPWTLLFLLPLGFLPFKESWGIISLVSLISLVFSVPQKKGGKADWLAILLLVSSFPAMRNLADGNLEAIVVAGIVLLVVGFARTSPFLLALGVILSTAKFQETWLLLLVLPYLIYRCWTTTQWIKLLVILLPILALGMELWGREWLAALLGAQFLQNPTSAQLSNVMGRGTLIDITLTAGLVRLGAPVWLARLAWLVLFGLTLLLSIKILRQNQQLTRYRAAFWVTASILLAPYASGDSFLTILALAVIPIFQQDRPLGIILLALVDLPYLASHQLLFSYQAFYWTILALAVWVILSLRLDKELTSESIKC
jgi:hypothetical protein